MNHNPTPASPAFDDTALLALYMKLSGREAITVPKSFSADINSLPFDCRVALSCRHGLSGLDPMTIERISIKMMLTRDRASDLVTAGESYLASLHGLGSRSGDKAALR